MLLSSLTHYISIEVSPLFYPCPCEKVLLLSHLCGSISLSHHHVEDLTVHGITSPNGRLQSIRLFFNISLPWFQGKQAMGEGEPAYQVKVVSFCFLRHTYVSPCTCPSQCSGQSSSRGLLSLVLVPLLHVQITAMFLLGFLGWKQFGSRLEVSPTASQGCWGYRGAHSRNTVRKELARNLGS